MSGDRQIQRIKELREAVDRNLDVQNNGGLTGGDFSRRAA